jgi:hypothetical protein
MKAKITILFSIVMLNTYSQTPSYDWVNAKSKLTYFAMSSDIKGNVYLSGTAYGPTTLGTVAIAAGDNFIAKISGLNEVMWVKKLPSDTCSFRTTYYGDDNRNIVADSIGNVYLTGYFIENFTINDYTITDTFYPTDYCLLKFDSIGNTQWVKTIATPDENVIAPRLQYFNDETIIVSGRFPTTLIFEDGTTVVNSDAEKQGVFLANFNSSGNLIEAKQFPPIVEPYPYAFGYDEESVFVNEEGNIFRAFATTAAEFSIDGISYEADSVFYYL